MAHPTLTVELKRIRDGRPGLTCIRVDGTRTWARLHPFFPTHDLAHCAVESVLGFDQAFFGLIAAGWDIDDFTAPGRAVQLPAQALLAERIVGHIERGLATNAAALADALATEAPAAETAPVTDAQLDTIRDLLADLIAAWRALSPGETLRVRFPVTASPGPES